MRVKHLVIAAGVTLGLAGVTPLPASSSDGPTGTSSRQIDLVIDTVDGVVLSQAEIDAHHQLQASFVTAEQTNDGLNYARTANMVNGAVSVVYVNPDTPEAVKTTMGAAINEWASAVALHPNAPLEMSVNWTDLGSSNILGSAGADDYFRGGPWASQDWIPAPLANVLAGYDYNPNRPEVRINFNSSFTDWHLDHTTAPSFLEYDLYTVALHEIGHGMGFVGSAFKPNGQGADLDLNAGAPLTYDRHVSFGDVPILEARLEGDPNAILTSGNLNFNLGGDRKYATYAPGPAFENGSSYSHFDESTYSSGSAGALMTPAISNGEFQSALDAPVLGVLAQIGWPMAVGVATPNIDSANPTPGQIQIGWSEDLFQKAVPAHYYNVSAYRSGILDASVNVDLPDNTAVLLNIQPGSDYEIILTPVSGTAFGVPAKIDVRSANDPSDSESPSTPGQPVIDSQDEGRNAKISWAASTDNVGVDKYRVYRSDNSLIKTVTTLSAWLSLDVGTHNVYIQAVDAAGNVSAASPQVQIVITADPIQEIATAPEFTAAHAEVLRLYWAFFNRDPDTSGAQYWIGISNQGFSLDVIAEQFVLSQEFQNTYGSTSNEDFLRIVYFNLLGRAADLSGHNYWIGQMNGGLSRGGVVRWIAANNEFIVQHPYPS
jgi:hypothetical protein